MSASENWREIRKRSVNQSGAEVDPGEWNEWRLLAVGDKATLWCNGQMGWKGAGLKPAKGHIGLQAESASLEFRNLRIREIEP